MTGMLFVMQQPGTSTMPKTSGSGCAQGKLSLVFLNFVNHRNIKYYKNYSFVLFPNIIFFLSELLSFDLNHLFNKKLLKNAIS